MALQVRTLTDRWNSATRSLRGLFASHAQVAFNTAIVLSIVMRDARVVEALEALARSLGAAMGVPGSCSYSKATQTRLYSVLMPRFGSRMRRGAPHRVGAREHPPGRRGGDATDDGGHHGYDADVLHPEAYHITQPHAFRKAG